MNGAQRLSVSKAVAADTESTLDFEAFFASEHGGLFSALCLITRNRHEAEDIMQESFTRVWERWDRVVPMSDPAGYLYRTAMNVFRNRYRRAKLVLRRAVGLVPSDDDLEIVESREDVIRLMAPLTPAQRAAIVLTDLLDYSSEEAAEVLGLRPGTVRTLASRGRAELRKIEGGNHE